MKNVAVVLISAFSLAAVHGWSPVAKSIAMPRRSGLFRRSTSELPRLDIAVNAATAAAQIAPSSKPLSPAEEKKRELLGKIRKEGGPLFIRTRLGALNPYGIFYGLTAIFIGLFWFVGLTACQLLYFLTGNRADKLRRLPVTVTQMWGETLLVWARAKPRIEGREKLVEFFKRKEAAMFVANHNSWLDIPFVGHTIGWRNYKLISKAELAKVPILGKAIKVGGNIMVDREDRRSQILTLKKGINMLKDGVHLCTFPEGTRSKSGRLGRFKRGAFKMAHKVGAPVIPFSIVGASKSMPHYWLFPFRPPRAVCKVIVHDPIESSDKTEEELEAEVRKAIIDGLPEEQRPLQ